MIWSHFVELVRSHQRFLLTSHVRPDGDAVGSELAMAAILRQLGKDVLVVNDFAVPPRLQFLDPQRKLKQLGTDISVKQLDACEVMIVLDTSAWAQLGAMAEVVRATGAKKVVLDHHVGGDDLGAELLKDVRAEATGRLVLEAADQLGVEITREIALPLFAAVATDTGWFRFSSTSSTTMRLAARLIDAGVVPEKLYSELYENDSLARLQLMGRAMARARTEIDGRLIHTFVQQADFRATGANPPDTEEIINMTLLVGRTEVAVFLVEQSGGGFRVSFRSRCKLDCNRLAEQFGGGGHKKAAGASLDGPLETVQTRVLDAVRAAMQ